MILIIDNDTVLTHALSEIFNFAGIPTTIAERYRQVAHPDRYRAVIFTSPEDDSDALAARAQLSRSSLIAVFREHREKSKLYDRVVFARSISSGLTRTVAEVQSELSLPSSLEYRLSGIDASVELKNVCYYFDTPIKLTRTECMILRFAIASFPVPVTSRQIAHHVFRRDRMPDESNVRTHICSLNKKFMSAVGRRIISSSEGGYTVLTPVTAEPLATV